MRFVALFILMVSIIALPLAGSGDHAPHLHAMQIDTTTDHQGDHSHDVEDEELADLSDHHHDDHTHEKAFVIALEVAHMTPSFKQDFVVRVDQPCRDRLYCIDRPPQPLMLA
jgi:hypothetical protein